MLTTKALLGIIDSLRSNIPDIYVPVGTPILEFIDMGHGGFINDEYVTAPSKMAYHSDGHNPFTFYEGVWNRALGWLYASDLYQAGLAYHVVSPGHKDYSLTSRCIRANSAEERTYKKEGIKTFFHSIHGNAFGLESVNGAEVFTAPGLTNADAIATQAIHKIVAATGFKMRADFSDGDPDKEARFTVLVKTNMPAYLSESGFYTNLAECKKMLDYSMMRKLSGAFLETHISVLHKKLLR